MLAGLPAPPPPGRTEAGPDREPALARWKFWVRTVTPLPGGKVPVKLARFEAGPRGCRRASRGGWPGWAAGLGRAGRGQVAQCRGFHWPPLALLPVALGVPLDRHCRFCRPGRCLVLLPAGLWAGPAWFRPGLSWPGLRLRVGLPGRAFLLPPHRQRRVAGWPGREASRCLVPRAVIEVRPVGREGVTAFPGARRAVAPGCQPGGRWPGLVLITLLWMLLILILL